MARRSGKGRLIIAAIVALGAIISYFSIDKTENEFTGEEQRISLTTEEEIMMGLQAAPQMAEQHGGLYQDPAVQEFAERIGQRLVRESAVGQTDYEFQFHVLADEQTVNAFALPGGQVFITAALMNRLDTPGQLAAVWGHEIGHVVGRHSAERIAKQRLTQGLTGAAVIATYDPQNPSSQGKAAMAAMIGQMVNMRYGREDELESDRLGVEIVAAAGYDPRSMLTVMEILASANQGAAPPEFMSTHPNPENRLGEIQRAIDAEFPNGVPPGLEQ